MTYIRDLLGNADIKTTEICARIDWEVKIKALERGMDLVPEDQVPIYQENKSLL